MLGESRKKNKDSALLRTTTKKGFEVKVECILAAPMQFDLGFLLHYLLVVVSLVVWQ